VRRFVRALPQEDSVVVLHMVKNVVTKTFLNITIDKKVESVYN